MREVVAGDAKLVIALVNSILLEQQVAIPVPCDLDEIMLTYEDEAVAAFTGFVDFLIRCRLGWRAPAVVQRTSPYAGNAAVPCESLGDSPCSKSVGKSRRSRSVA